MSRLVLFVGLLMVSGGCSPPTATTQSVGEDSPHAKSADPPSGDEAEAKAIALVKQLGGRVERDERLPGKPVVTVVLIDAPATDADLKQIAAITTLTELNVVRTKVTDAGVKELTALKNLTVLQISGCEVTDTGLQELAALKQLRTLYLTSTNVTDAGLKRVAALGNLAELGLAGTEVTDAGLKELGALKNLTYLVLSQTNVTDAGVKELEEALPKCGIAR